MRISIRKLGVLAIMAAFLVILAALRPTAQTPVAQAVVASAGGIEAPGGIAALPSAIPAMPGVTNQQIPAIIGTGQKAIVAVFCSPSPVLPPILPFMAGPCPGYDNGLDDAFGTADDIGGGTIYLKLTQVYPVSGAVPMATFAASGSDTLVVTDNGSADMDAAIGVIAVEVDAAAATQGGTLGVNEIDKVQAADESAGAWNTGCCGAPNFGASVNIVVVDTMLAWGPTGAISTASQGQPAFVSYHCDVLGREDVSGAAATFAETTAGNADGQQGLNDMYDGLYGPNALLKTSPLCPIDPVTLLPLCPSAPGLGWGSNNIFGRADNGISDVWCGGNTSGLFDDFVDFNTDKGIFSVDPMAVDLQTSAATAAASFLTPVFYPPVLDPACDTGKNIDTYDIDALSVWGAFLPFAPFGQYKGGCDLDGWRNGVATTELLGNGEVGVATITAQQGGGVGTPRTINVTFEGTAALSLFITAPSLIGLTGGDFTVALVDQNGLPVGDQTLACTVDPASGAMVILNQTGTTGSVTSANPGQVTFKLVPTGLAVVAGTELTLTCVLDRDHSIKATAKVTLSATPDVESVALVQGCNPIAATWPDATAIAKVAGAVAPPEALTGIWKFDTATSTWKGFSPSAPAAVSDLATVDRLDAIFICVNAAATVARPVI